MKIIKITEIHADKRLDRVLKAIFPDMPMSAMFKHLRTGKIKLNKKRSKPEDKTQLGDELYIFLSPEETIQTTPKESGVDFAKLKDSSFFKKNFQILFEDDDILVLNKPAGIAVHPGSKHYSGKTMLDLAQAHTAGKTGEFQTQLVHRLDLDTSGVLLCAKTPKALRTLNSEINDDSTQKQYYALCNGRIEKDSGTIKLALERTEGKSKSTKIIVSKKGGKDSKMSITHFEVIERFGDKATLIAVKLETGRMHQIRVHMKSQGHSLWGDEHYGDFALNKEIAKEPYKLKRMFLHAFSLTFLHPTKKTAMTVKAPLPEDLQNTLKALKK